MGNAIKKMSEDNKPSSKHERRIQDHKLDLNESASIKTKSKKFSKKITISIIALIVLAIIAYSSIAYYTKPGKYDDFAKCLTEKSFKMYGADWCPNCKKQKNIFGKSFKYVDYIECTKQKEDCAQAEITGYPTWIYNEEKYIGVQSLSRLSSVSECALSN